MKNRILITGVAGFVGFSLAKKLLETNKKIEVHGIDNLSKYYDPKLKKSRLKILKNYPNFFFKNLSICNFKKLYELINNNKFDKIIHLAAQAGVRYSFEHPKSYLDTNINGTYNILEIIKNSKPKHFIFSSTSSTYGFTNKKTSFIESNESNFPISLYASTKKSCEVMIHNYSHNFNIPSTVLRFFTVYGPWGRPDMALFKFTRAILENKPIEVFNSGKLWRDFTYIDDLVISIIKLLKITPSIGKKIPNDSISKNAPYRTVNIGNQKAVNLMKFINTLEKITSRKAKYIYAPMQKGDVPFTLANSNLLYQLTNYRPSTSVEEGIKKFYDWYIDYYIEKKYD